MRGKNFMFSVAAAAVLAAFNPALAQDSSTLNVSPNVGVDANVSPGVNVGSGDQSVSSSVSANQQSTDIGSSVTGQASGSTSAEAQTGSTGSGASAQGSASGDAAISASGEDKERHGRARGHDPDKLTGLDRADQAAGEHGQKGRDTAREKQGG
jgi:hypothetical protein